MIGSEAALLGAQIRRYRQNAAISQEELAERSGVSVRTISDLERGIRNTARLDTVRLLATGLELADADRTALLAAAIAGAADDGSGAGKAEYAPLPQPANALIGRGRLIDEIVAEFERGTRLLTLTGPGGVGKTRVAIEAAAVVAERTARPAVFVPLAPVSDAARVSAAIAQALGILANKASPDDSLTTYLAKRRLILVLDNFEHLLEATPLVTQLIQAGPGLTVLATSRSRLRLSGEREIGVSPLDLPEMGASAERIAQAGAVRLFLWRASAVMDAPALLQQHPEIVAEICRRVDGLPLSIELAASKLRVMPAETLLEVLEHRLPVLTGGNRDQPSRQQSMRATIGWSYGLLNAGQQSLYRWLAVFTGGFSAEAVSMTGRSIGFETVEAFANLDGLLDSGLVQRTTSGNGSPRFQMLETIREYGIERLDELGELENARMSHARFAYDFVAPGAPNPCDISADEWTRRVEQELGNVMAAFDWVCRPETAAFCIDFASVLGGYWDFKGPVREGAARLRKAADLAPPIPTLAAARTMFWALALSNYAGEYDLGRSYAEAALRIALEFGSPEAEAFATHALAWNAELRLDVDISIELYGRALDLWTKLDEDGPQAQILMLLGGLWAAKGDLGKARELEEAARVMFEQYGRCGCLGTIEWYLGYFDAAEGKFTEAARRFQRTLELWIGGPDQEHSAKPLIHLAGVAAAMGDWETAATLTGCCDAILERTGDVLFPFDIPVWERAAEDSRNALGKERFVVLHDDASFLGPVDWLQLAEKVVKQSRLRDLTSVSFSERR